MADPTNAELAAAWLQTAKWELVRQDNQGPGIEFQILTRKVEQAPRDLLDALLTVLSTAGTTYTGALVEGKSFEGTWYQGHAWWTRAARGQEDNLVTLWQVLVCGAGQTWTFTVPGANGTTTHTLYQGKTKAAVDALLSAVSLANNNHSSPSYSEETGRWSGVIVSSPASNNSTDAAFAKTGPLVEFRTKMVQDNGQDYLISDAVQYSVRAGYLLTSAYEFYDGGLEGEYGAFLRTNTNTGYWYFKRVGRVDRQVWLVTKTEPTNPNDTDVSYTLLRQYNLFLAVGAPWGAGAGNPWQMPVRRQQGGAATPPAGEVFWPDPEGAEV